MNTDNIDYENLSPEKREKLIQLYQKKRKSISERQIHSIFEQRTADREYLDTLYHLEKLGVKL